MEDAELVTGGYEYSIVLSGSKVERSGDGVLIHFKGNPTYLNDSGIKDVITVKFRDHRMLTVAELMTMLHPTKGILSIGGEFKNNLA